MLGASSITQSQPKTKYPVSVLTGTGTLLGWNTPIPFKNIELPKFPVVELPATVNGYVRAVAETTQTSTDISAVASLAVLALCPQAVTA